MDSSGFSYIPYITIASFDRPITRQDILESISNLPSDAFVRVELWWNRVKDGLDEGIAMLVEPDGSLSLITDKLRTDSELWFAHDLDSLNAIYERLVQDDNYCEVEFLVDYYPPD